MNASTMSIAQLKAVIILGTVAKFACGILVALSMTGCASQMVRPDHDKIEQARIERTPKSLSCVGTHIHRRCRVDQQVLAKPSIQIKDGASPMAGKKR